MREWHEAGGHCSRGTLRRHGLPWDYGECRYCTEANLRRISIQRNGVVKTVWTNRLDRVSVDLIGPVERSVGGNRFVLHIFDVFRRYSWCFGLTRKSESLEAFRRWSVRMKRELELKLKEVMSNNGGEFSVSEFWEMVGSCGG